MTLRLLLLPLNTRLVMSLYLLLAFFCISPAQAFSGSSVFVTIQPFVGEQTISDFDAMKHLLIHGGLSKPMKNHIRRIMRKYYADDLAAYIEKRHQRNKRFSDDVRRRMTNAEHENNEGFT